jgi:hypothetical protein
VEYNHKSDTVYRSQKLSTPPKHACRVRSSVIKPETERDSAASDLHQTPGAAGPRGAAAERSSPERAWRSQSSLKNFSAARVADARRRTRGPKSAASKRVSPGHRPSVTFGFASAPARLPSATRIVTPARTPTVASGRLDGLPRRRYTLLRQALPEDCPVRQCAHRIENWPRTLSNPARPTVAPLLVHHGARESRAPPST